MDKRKTAGELVKQVAADTTKYNILEVGHALAETIEKECRESVRLHYNMIDEPEFCVVMIIASDPLIKGIKRRKFYCWPYLPSPRPNQSVWLYKKTTDKFKRLWILPDAKAMAKLASVAIVDKEFQTMQAWSCAFYCGQFWEYIRHEHSIDMLSETEYLKLHRDELIKAGCQVPGTVLPDAFDFSKISVNKVVQPSDIIASKEVLKPLVQV